MKTREIAVSLSYTHNLGNYESIRIEAREVVELGDQDSPQEAYSYAESSVRSRILSQLNDFNEKLSGGSQGANVANVPSGRRF